MNELSKDGYTYQSINQSMMTSKKKNESQENKNNELSQERKDINKWIQ